MLVYSPVYGSSLGLTGFLYGPHQGAHLAVERWMFPKRAAANGCSYVTDLAKYKGQIKDKVLYAESLV